MASRGGSRYLRDMPTLPATPEAELDDDDAVVWPPANETADGRAARVERERIMIEEAEEDIRQGRFLSGQAAEDWLDRWAAGEPVDVPFER